MGPQHQLLESCERLEECESDYQTAGVGEGTSKWYQDICKEICNKDILML